MSSRSVSSQHEFPRLLVLNLFTSAHCFIAQMCLTVGLSYIFSNSVFVFSFFTGLYLMAMGLGVALIERYDLTDTAWEKGVIVNSLIGLMLSSPGIVVMLFMNEGLYVISRSAAVDLTWMIFPLGIVMTVLIGMVSGAELPIFSKLVEAKQWPTSRPVIGVLVSDYFGAFCGIILFAFVLYPFFGLLNAIFIAQIGLLVVIDILWQGIPAFRKDRLLGAIIVAFNVYAVLMFINRDTILRLLDGMASLPR